MFVPVLILLLLLGLPVGVAFALVIVGWPDLWNMDLRFAASTTIDTLQSYPLLAVPLFILAGELMTKGGLVRQLVSVADLLLSWARAPMGNIMIAASAMMGAITGSSVATVAAIGGAIGPEMRSRGYEPGYVAALNAASGLLGVLIPPSIPLILYGSVVGVSITQLFLAAALPGVLFMLAFMAVHTAVAGRVLPGRTERSEASAAEGPQARPRPAAVVLRAIPALLLPVIVLGGIYSGLFTPTEAAGIAAVYALIAALATRQGAAEVHGIFFRSAVSAAAIMFVIGLTSIFNRAMVLEQIPQDIAAFATASTGNPVLFLLAVNLALLLIGMFMETSAAVLLMGPLLAPAAGAFGIDPVHFGIVLVVNIEIGLLTPPLAANLYVASLTNRVPLVRMLRHVAWFLAAAVAVLLLLTFVPFLSLWYRLL